MHATQGSETLRTPQQTPISGMWPYAADISGPGEGTPRGRALAIIWAARAADLGATEFRRAYLDGALLSAEEVADWIGDVSQREGHASWWHDEVPHDLLQPIGDSGEGGYRIPPQVMQTVQKSLRYLWYATPAHEAASVPVHMGGVLDELRLLAAELLHTYWIWAPRDLAQYVARASVRDVERTPFLNPLTARAATFVLTGYAPLINESLLERQYPLPQGSGRQQTERALQLAALWAVWEQEHVPLARRFEEWNSRFPHWHSSTPSNFSRDSRDAVRRLIEPPTRKRLKQAATALDPAAAAAILRRGVEHLLATGEDSISGWSNSLPALEQRASDGTEDPEIIAINEQLRDGFRELHEATSEEERMRAKAWIQELQMQLERVALNSSSEQPTRSDKRA